MHFKFLQEWSSQQLKINRNFHQFYKSVSRGGINPWQKDLELE